MYTDNLTAVFGLSLHRFRRYYSHLTRDEVMEAYAQGLHNFMDLFIEQGEPGFLVGLNTTTDIVAAESLIGLREAYPEDHITVHCMIPQERLTRLPSRIRVLWDSADSRSFGSIEDMVDRASRLFTVYKRPMREPAYIYAAHKLKPLFNVHPFDLLKSGIDAIDGMDELVRYYKSRIAGHPQDAMQ